MLALRFCNTLYVHTQPLKRRAKRARKSLRTYQLSYSITRAHTKTGGHMLPRSTLNNASVTECLPLQRACCRLLYDLLGAMRAPSFPIVWEAIKVFAEF